VSDITKDYSFGGWLRAFRLKREITLRDMCRIIGWDAGNYSKLERSELSPPRTKNDIERIVAPLKLEQSEFEMLLSTAFSFHVGQLRKNFE
jgi:transcriptional regulator with XRE-family HTH domain